MANTIVLAKNYVPLLDEVYKRESVTADLTGDPAMARAGANAAEIVYPQIAVTGLVITTETVAIRRALLTLSGHPRNTTMTAAQNCRSMQWTIRKRTTLHLAWLAQS